jgi:hypothetical protein
MTTFGSHVHRAAGEPLPSSRRANRAAARAFRPRRVLPSVITAVVLLALGLIAAIEIISALVGGPARLLPYDSAGRWAATTRWNDTGTIVAGTILSLLGLLLLLIALVPGRPRFIPLLTGDRDLVIGMHRRSFTRALAHAAESVAGIDSAKARWQGNRIHVTATTSLRDTRGLNDAVRQAVSSKLTSLGPASTPHLSFSLRKK